MLKASLIKVIFVNIICIPSLHKFFSSFIIFSTWTTRTISKSGLFKCISSKAQIYLLPIKVYLLFHSFYIDNNYLMESHSMELHLKQNVT